MIKMLVMDVDGTLTDGSIYMSDKGEVIKRFHVQDGYGIKNLLPEQRIKSTIITGRQSDILTLRAGELEIDELVQNESDKQKALEKIMKKYNLSYSNIAYIGDDLNDLSCIEKCGLSACPNDAIPSVKKLVDYICEKSGGRGAVREFIDYIILRDKQEERR